MRRLALPAILLAGCCGGAQHADWAQPQTLRLDWSGSDGGVEYSVRALTLTPRGWRVDASVTNRSATPLDVVRPHRAGKTKFALLAGGARFRPEAGTAFYEISTEPLVPRVLQPGEMWRGTFSGLGRFPRGTYLRVMFGRFSPPGRAAAAFQAVTAQTVRLAR